MRTNFDARALRVEGAALPQWQGQPALLPVRLEGCEGVNRLFEYRLLLKTPDSRSFGPSLAANFKLNEFVGRELTVHIELEGSGTYLPGAVGRATDAIGTGTREITGLVDSARFVKIAGRYAFYELVLRPWLHLATRTSDCKILHNKTVVEILDEVLADYPFPVEKRLGTQYPERETQTQLNETDADFLMRLCQEWGINFHFEHSDGKHRLVLGDSNDAFQESPSEAYRELRFHDGRNQIDEEFITEFTVTDTLTSGSYESRDFDYTRPKALLAARVRDPRDTGQSGQDVFRWRADDGSDYSQPNAGRLADANQTEPQGELLAHLRMEALRQHGLRAQGAGELRGLLPGHAFRLKGHPQDLANGDHVAIDTELLIEDVAAVSQMNTSAVPTAQGDEAPTQQWRVQLRFESQPVRLPLRPDFRISKPRQHSPETALVVGASDAQGVPNNIYTDEFGRIKVQFYWDRYGEKDHRSSCWVRVSSEWAGNQMGAVHLPRVGQEVIVSFIGGDPDLPLVTGRVFNQHNLPPWQLPQQQALSGFRSRELKPGGGNSAAGRSNHLIFDDTSDSIQAQLKSDHQHSQLNLGDITRIDDQAGRKDKRGEGFELATQGYGGVRAVQGLHITTESAPGADAHVLSCEAATARLANAQAQHDSLADTARQAGAQDLHGDQHEVAQALDRQIGQIEGKGVGSARDAFPEFSAPHLMLASPAGIETSTAGSTHIVSGEHTAISSAGHASVSSGGGFFASVRGAIRMFAYRSGIRLVAALQDIDIAALERNLKLLAKLNITMTAERITIEAKQEVLVNGGGSFTLWQAGRIVEGTRGTIERHAAGAAMRAPLSLDAVFPLPAVIGVAERERLLEEHFVLLEHGSGLRLGGQKYRVVFDGGRTVEGRTNAQGETQIVQSMVTQIATVELLRHAEDGVLARYTPQVRTPAEARYDAAPAPEKRERAVGGQKLKPNADQATTEGRAPVHTSCDPNNWGLRMHVPDKGGSTPWDYPVARGYVNDIQKALRGMEWKGVDWPLQPNIERALVDCIGGCIRSALYQTAFALPQAAIPMILVPNAVIAQKLGINLDDDNLQGVMVPDYWNLAICKGAIVGIASAMKGDGDLDAALRNLASTVYHEARHAQQFFWMSALLQQFPADYAHLPHIQQVWRGVMPADMQSLAAATPLPGEPSARIGLHRMLIGQYYWLLRYHQKHNAEHPEFKNMLSTELPLARKAAYELLQDVGLGGLPIDVDQMASGVDGGNGYRMRPWEEDSFICDEIVKRVWDGGTHAVLLQPGYCTNALRHAVSVFEEQAKGGRSEQ